MKLRERERDRESNADEHTLMERFGVFYTDIICGRKESLIWVVLGLTKYTFGLPNTIMSFSFLCVCVCYISLEWCWYKYVVPIQEASLKIKVAFSALKSSFNLQTFQKVRRRSSFISTSGSGVCARGSQKGWNVHFW